MTIKINNTQVRLRPSSVDSFYQCSYQWGKTFLEGITTIPNARAAIGTSIHKAAEVLWTEAIATGKKDANLGKLTDAAIAAWKEETHDGVKFDDGENDKTAAIEIMKGTETFIEDIVPFSSIPDAVEQRFTIPLTNPIVTDLSGTVDYIAGDIIADVKTSKRKPVVESYTVQQSIYRLLANHNGKDVKRSLIQGIVLKAQPEGMILPLEVNLPQAKSLVNGILATMELIASDKAPIETILRGNPKYYLCSNKYCALHSTCPWVNGDAN